MTTDKTNATSLRILLSLLFCGSVFAQQPAVIGVRDFSHSVEDLDKSVKFYKDVFGLELSRPPTDLPDAGVASLVSAPGIHLRLATFKLPGENFGLELTQFSGPQRKGGVPEQFWPEHVYPGAVDLQLKVRDMNTVFGALVNANARIITRSGQPVKIGPERKIRSILVRDPDGYILNVIDTPPAAGAPEGLVHGVAMGVTVEDLDKTRKFYHDMLGFDFTANTEFSDDKAILDMVGAANAKVQFREMTTKVPGTAAQIDFYEYRNIPRRTFHLNVYDPGAPAMVLRVKDLAGVLKRLKAIGTPIVSAKGEIVPFAPATRSIFVTDPNGLNLEIYESKQ
jgi:catechol 2,3-dioxygenase-like lactoylglutathione lyase family enzyme